MSHIPYRVTIELAIGPTGKTVQVTGETPDLGYASDVLLTSESALCAITANVLAWQGSAMAGAASDHARFDAMTRALNMPLNSVPH